MKRKLSVVVVLILAAVGIVVFIALRLSIGDNKNTGTPIVSDSRQWKPVLSDNFNGTALDSSKWSTCYDWRLPSESGCTNGGNFEQEWYLPGQVTVKDGMAVLSAVSDPITAPSKYGPLVYPYRSGMISTGRADTTQNVKWSGLYGYYEARMKLVGGQGVWPAFWLLPTDRRWPPEIDVMELLGNNPGRILQTVHWKDANGHPQKDGNIIPGPDYTVGWHTYGVNWQPGRIDWYLDGQRKKTVTGPHVPDKPMELIINLAIGGMLPGNADASTMFPRTLSVDYIKVYQMNR